MREVLHNVAEAVGAGVYVVSYVPIWLVWNVAGKHVFRAFRIVKERSERTDADDMIKTGATIEVLRESLANAYYNKIVEERRCARSV